MTAFRDGTVVVIETGRTHIRAAVGLSEFLKLPAMNIQARVGIRKEMTARRPETTASTSQTLASVNDYLVGTQLDDAIAAGQDLAISWPFSDGNIKDWTQAEALWKYVLFSHLKIRRAQNESPVLLSMFAGLSRRAYERISQIFFERYNAAGFSLVQRPVSQLYAANSINGIVVDIDQDITDISPICDGFLLSGACKTVPLGITDCQAYLAHLLRANTSVSVAFSSVTDPLELEVELKALALHVWNEGLIRIPSDGQTAEVPEEEGITDIAAVIMAGKERAVIEQGMKKKANAKASAAEQARAKEIEALDLVTTTFKGQEITLGKERHRFCEPLFEPSLLDNLSTSPKRPARESLQNAIGYAISQVDVMQRQSVWQGLFVTGEMTAHLTGLGTSLKSRLSSFILSHPEQHTEVQPRHIRVLAIPEYFADFRDKGDHYAGFLGLSIVAKIVFNESLGKNFVSKQDYVEHGPKAVIQMTAALL